MNVLIRSVVFVLSFLLFACSSKPANKSNTGGNQSGNAKEAETSTSETGMVYFQGGTFLMGSANGTPQEQPVHQVTVKPFKIDKYPVTVKAFRQFIEATGYQTDAEKFGDSGIFDFESQNWILVPGANWQYPLGPDSEKAEDNHPVTQVSWNDAVAYAKWVGKRLPTEAEWEFAARCGGKNYSKFSWGSDLIKNGKYMANVWQGNDISAKQGADGFILTSPVGYYGETPCGLTDMGGNVWNWCADSYQPYPGSAAESQPNPQMKVIRGGSFFFDQNGENSYSSTGRSSNTQETSLFNTGFRCASSEK